VVAERAHIPIPVGVATDDPQAVQRVQAVLHDRIAASKGSNWRAAGVPNAGERMAKRAIVATEPQQS